MLYRRHKGYLGHKKQYETHLDLVLKKEKGSRSLSFSDICRYTEHRGWPRTTDEVVERERHRYRQLCNFVKSLENDWLLLTYENMVAGHFDALNEYLGFDVQADTVVPSSSGKAKVVRKKAAGDWRHWFTEEDVEEFPACGTPPEALHYHQLDGESLFSRILSAIG